MSPSAFHRQFKALTSSTPLQYQKQLRLLEARRLMISCAASVETASFEVGYESPSQFSREYARMSGTSPKRDAMALQAALREGRAAANASEANASEASVLEASVLEASVRASIV
jgi:AraC-like DNA-binding protein